MPPWISLTNSSRNGLKAGGPLGDVVRYLAVSLNLSYELVVPQDKAHGLLKNNVWTGLIGMLHRKVWLLLFFSIIVLMVFAAGVSYLAPSTSAQQNYRNRTLKNFKILKFSTLETMFVLSSSTSGRLLSGCWGLCLIILMSAWGSNLKAQLTVPEKPHYIDSLEDLLHSENVTPIVLNGTNYHNYFNHSDPVRWALWNRISARGGATTPNRFYNQSLDSVRSGTGALVTEYIGLLHALAYIQNRNSRFHISKEQFHRHFLGLGLGKHLNRILAELINQRVLRYIGTGHVDHYERGLRLRSTNLLVDDVGAVEEDSQEPLRLPNTTSVFYLWIMCIGVSTLTAFVEYGYACVRPTRTKASVYIDDNEYIELEMPTTSSYTSSTANSEETCCTTYYPTSDSILSYIKSPYRLAKSSYASFQIGSMNRYRSCANLNTYWTIKESKDYRGSTSSLSSPKPLSERARMFRSFLEL